MWAWQLVTDELFPRVDALSEPVGAMRFCQRFHGGNMQPFLRVRKPTFCGTIHHIVLSRADEQVGWSNAQGIVAMVKDKQTLGDRTESESVCVSMSISLSTINPHATILIPFCTRPHPAHPTPVT